jgi:hypothetical protein
MVSKRTGMIITAVIAVLYGCAGVLTCLGGLLTAPFSTLPYEFTGWVWFGTNVCSGLAFLALPVVFYILFVANRPDDPPSSPDPTLK